MTASTAQIPTGWSLTRLGEVLSQNNSGEKLNSTKLYRLLGVRLAGQGPFLREEKLGQQIQASHLSKVHSGDFIYSRLFAWRGAFGVIPEDLDGAHVSNEFPTFSVDRSRLDVDFLRLYFSQRSVWSDVEAFCTGTTKASRNRFKEAFFLDVNIPLPPLDEQCCIVARVNGLAAKIDRARELRNLATAETSALWASALSAAYGPKGNGSWIEKDASALLVEQAAAYEHMPRMNFNSAHPWEPSIGLDALYKLPAGWVWTDLGSVLTHLVDCINDTPDFATERTGLLGLKSTNIRPYKFNLSEQWFVTVEDFKRWNRREEPRPGDIVLTREAPMGNTCLLPEGVKVCLTQRLMLLRCDNSFVRRRYILHYLNTTQFKDEVTELCRGLTTPHIRVQDAPNLRVPLAPLPIQDLIVTQLDALQEKLAALGRSQSETAAELDALMPSILSRAFRGEL